MHARTSHRTLSQGRLTRRLVLLFLGAALVPVLLSDWLSIDVMTQVAERFDRDSRQQTTRQVSRQVLDRLLAAKDVMTAAVRARPAPAAGPGEIFRETVFPASGSNASGTAGADADAGDLASLWRRAAPDRELAAPRNADNDSVRVELRTAAAPGGAPRVLLGASIGQALVGVAELRPEFVWAPVVNANEDTVWYVRDERGQVLMVHRGDDVATTPKPDREFESRLFLTNEFASGSWRFEQRAAAPALRWHGVPLVGWLGGVALATLLVVGLYGGRQIRRMLAPLDALTHGTRQLAAGVTATRVAVEGDDEMSALGDAFNEMASELEAQFSTLRNLADIDAGILAGVPLSELAQRVADQLLCLYPHTSPSVHWREDVSTLRSVTGRAAYAAATVMVTDLPITECERFEQLLDGDKSCLALGAPCAGLNPNGAASPAASPTVLAIREAGRTRAVIRLHLAEGVLIGSLKPARDLTDRLAVALVARTREQQLVHRAVHDPLTGLANGYGLQTHLERLLADQAGAELALLFVDLDHFKEVNDRHGHGTGDELLRVVGARISACLPAPALLARKGGDEFVVVLPGADAEAACASASRITGALSLPAPVRGIGHSCSASIGIALCPAHGRTQEELLRCADVALYVAKGAGRSRHAVFDLSFDTAARERTALLSALRTAVVSDELVVHYQPRLRASDGFITSAEALVRWQHPQRGLLMPGSFIELAEASGLIGPIGDWVLDRSCAQIARWHAQGRGLERVSVNVSAHQLAPGDLPEKVAAALTRHAIAGHQLEIEVTESLLVGDVRAAHTQLVQIQALGVTIAMDDFGTGYSSMALLRKLPIDVLKIDRAFVTDMVGDTTALAITRTIVTLAKSLSLRLVAEGIETEGQASLLRSMGCDEFQGFLYGRPVDPDAFDRLPRDSLYAPSAQTTLEPVVAEPSGAIA